MPDVEKEALNVSALKVVGLGGSLREASRSRAALAVALEGAAAGGATVELLDLRAPAYRQ
jgi:NAD(P)H-dependent FMN reductase